VLLDLCSLSATIALFVRTWIMQHHQLPGLALKLTITHIKDEVRPPPAHVDCIPLRVAHNQFCHNVTPGCLPERPAARPQVDRFLFQRTTIRYLKTVVIRFVRAYEVNSLQSIPTYVRRSARKPGHLAAREAADDGGRV
jgi:hypothetical protein